MNIQAPSPQVLNVLQGAVERIFDTSPAEFEEIYGMNRDEADIEVSAFLRSLKRPRATEDTVDDLVGEWHESDGDNMQLWEYLGWTEKEYSHWVETTECPE